MSPDKASANRNGARVTLLDETMESLREAAKSEGKSISQLVSEYIMDYTPPTKDSHRLRMCITPEADQKLREIAQEQGARNADILRHIITKRLR